MPEAMRLISLQRILSFYEPLIVELRAISLLKNFIEELNLPHPRAGKPAPEVLPGTCRTDRRSIVLDTVSSRTHPPSIC